MKYLFCSMEIMTFLSEIINNAHNKHLILISNRSHSQKYLLTQDFNKMPNLDQKLARRLQIQLLKTETQDHTAQHSQVHLFALKKSINQVVAYTDVTDTHNTIIQADQVQFYIECICRHSDREDLKYMCTHNKSLFTD